MSRSLASVDSEGSWLSGKPINKLSSKARKYRSGGSLSGTRQPEDFSASNEELRLHHDLTPQPGEVRRASGPAALALGHKASSKPIAPDEEDAGVDTDEELRITQPRHDDDDVHTVVHNGAGRQPTVVHRDMRVRSSEGLLKQYNESTAETAYNTPPVSPGKGEHATNEDDDDGDGESPSDEVGTPETISVRRASSVNVGAGGHARRISAGSAKLLDIPKRASQSGSRTSTAEPSTPMTEQSKM
jgi:hypothetical protein